jgi:Ni/Co efflux regulator RcnB
MGRSHYRAGDDEVVEMFRWKTTVLVLVLGACAAGSVCAQKKTYYYRPITRATYTHQSSTRNVWRDEDGDGINDVRQVPERKRYTYSPVHRDRHLYSPYRYQPNTRYPDPPGHRTGVWWNVGTRLPSAYYGPNYTVDFRRYRLPPPPEGCRWVRVENDVYLVHSASGLIRDALYQLFY